VIFIFMVERKICIKFGVGLLCRQGVFSGHFDFDSRIFLFRRHFVLLDWRIFHLGAGDLALVCEEVVPLPLR
jgi:hypothetical protein